ncbi:MAG: T9SS type A sorting domain-containing protein [Bacteroidia bacterium]|nr:T9SS type A sorting domain-containing protein [Bacteroidia bacterium]
MKRSLLILLTVFCVKGFSQSSILVTNITNTNSPVPMVANQIIANTTTFNATSTNDIDVKNTSGSTKVYSLKRYDVVKNAGADPRFCFASQCYGTGQMVSLQSLTLTGGQSASEVQGSFQIITADLDEFTAVGYSYIKYTLTNVANTSDSLQFSIKYNAPSGVNELNANALSAFELFPNPASDATVLKVSSLKAMDAKVIVYNALGAVVSEKAIVIAEGKNKIDLNINDLSSGVYFAQIKMANSSVTKKLVVK